MKKIFVFLMLMVMALTPVCFADAQNETTTKPRILTMGSGTTATFTGATVTMPVSQPLTTPVVSGWVAASSMNQSCVTTCGIASPIVAFESTSGLFVATNSATADSCVCSGAIS